jgi:chromosome segregation ATPase
MGILATAFIEPPRLLAALLLNASENAKMLIENSGNIANGWLAFIGVLAGGALTKVIDRYFAAHERRIKQDEKRRELIGEEEKIFRQDLRDQLRDVRQELLETRNHVGDLQTMVDDWREKYYQNVAENIELNKRYVDLQATHREQGHELAELKQQHDELQSRFDTLAHKVREAGVHID